MAESVKVCPESPLRGDARQETQRKMPAEMRDEAATPPNLDPVTVGRRLKAACALCGWTVRDLERAIKARGDRRYRGNDTGLAYTTLRNIEAGTIDKQPDGQTLEYLAVTCRQPKTWFHVDSIGEAVRVRLPEVARLPGLTGELGRRVGADTQDPQDQRPGESPGAGDEGTGTDG